MHPLSGHTLTALCMAVCRGTQGSEGVPKGKVPVDWVKCFHSELLLEKPVLLLTFQTRFLPCSLLILINLAFSD